jgi:hypothetical protein
MNLPQTSVDIWIRIPVHFKDVNKIPNMRINTQILHKNGNSNKDRSKNGSDYGHGEESKKRKLSIDKVTSNKDSENDWNEKIVDISTKSWNLWDNFRLTSNSDKRVYVALEFFKPEDLLVCTEGESRCFYFVCFAHPV